MRLKHHPLIKKFLKIKESLRIQFDNPVTLNDGTICIIMNNNLTDIDIEELLKYVYKRKKDYLDRLSKTLNRFEKEYKKRNTGPDHINVKEIYKKREKEISDVVENLHISLISIQIHLTTRYNIDMSVNNHTYDIYVTNLQFYKLFGAYCGVEQLISQLEIIK